MGKPLGEGTPMTGITQMVGGGEIVLAHEAVQGRPRDGEPHRVRCLGRGGHPELVVQSPGRVHGQGEMGEAGTPCSARCTEGPEEECGPGRGSACGLWISLGRSEEVSGTRRLQPRQPVLLLDHKGTAVEDQWMLML